MKVVVFDLGGVLLRLKDPVETFSLDISGDEFLARWLKSPSVREFERGGLDLGGFARSLVEELELPMDWREFLRRFEQWPDLLYPDAAVLLDSIPAGIHKALLSNTNAAHWGRADIEATLLPRLDRVFLSFRTGILKPDREAFTQVVDHYGLEPESFLFFDDNPLNVSGALAAGMQASLCKGPGDALRLLGSLGEDAYGSARSRALPEIG